MKVTKAVIMAAGYGTRFLPVTKALRKELLPVLNRPVIDYGVEACVKAGITDIIIITRAGDHQIEAYYSTNFGLERFLESNHKTQIVSELKCVESQAHFTFIEQKEGDGYGTGAVIKLVEPYIKSDEAFAVLNGDDIMFRQDGGSDIADMIELIEHTNAEGVILGQKFPRETLVNRYAVINVNQENNFYWMQNLVERPTAEQVTSEFGNLGKYIFTPKIFTNLARIQPNEAHGEYFITDAINSLALEGKVVMQLAKGEFLDCGTPAAWLRSNLRIAMADPDLKKDLATYFQYFA